ncbi:hypothetical protein C8Q75DRAFT_864673 [Abortiporus biennis]|nr:hypothetical protein C8Q75DRAFT_864673 [Abortiporus biennis]
MASRRIFACSNRLKRRSEEISDSALDRTHPNQVTNVAQAQEYVKNEMRNCIFSNRSEFINTFFNKIDDKQCKRILDSLTKKGLYKPKAGRRKTPFWTNLPRRPSNETVLYAPLVEILNAITEEQGSTHGGLRLSWRDVHNKAPSTVVYNTHTDTRPDIIGEYAEGEDTLRDVAWWYRIAILIELKKLHTAEDAPTLVQLLQYARQTFKEQPFRRFLFGFTFHRTDMTFWHCDRAGAIGSIMINIHDSPLIFIKCIASCVAMDPVEHGFDPTFMAYDKASKKTYDPWNIPPELLEPGASTSRTLPKAQWVVSMPGDHRKDGNEREEFVLFAALSLNRAEVVKGRAGRIWLAQKRSEVENQELSGCKVKTYVFKDNWHDSRRTAEGSIYKAEGDVNGVAKLYSYETVKVNDTDDLTSSARRGFEVPADTKPMSLRRAIKPTPKDIENYYNVQRHSNALPVDGKDLAQWLDVFQQEKHPHPVYHRDHHRLLLSSYGHQITEFVSREELAVVFEDTINGHRILVEKKFLHRDVSRGNVVISDEESPNKGLLIDQDYTIANFDDHTATVGDTRTGTPAFMAVEILTGKPIVATVVAKSAADLERAVHNDMDDSQPGMKSAAKRNFIYHQPVHDLESFFWLLCWICVTRAGPSTGREYDLNSEKDLSAIDLVKNLFEEENMVTLGNNKRDLFQSPSLFGCTIKETVTPYFNCFVDLLISLHIALYVAYRDGEYEDLHEKFIEKIKSFRNSLKDAKIPAVEGEEAMVKRAKHRRASHNYVIQPELPIAQLNPEAAGPTVQPEVEPGSPSHLAAIRRSDRLKKRRIGQ